MLFILLFFSGFLYGGESQEFIKSINFNPILEDKKDYSPEDYAYFHELSAWANNHMLILEEDNKLLGLKDGICRAIPPEGFSFKLTIDVSHKRPVYLYLDVTRYKSINSKNVSVSPRTLSIYVNQNLKQKIYFDGKRNYLNGKLLKGNRLVPINLDPVEFMDGNLRIKLVPDVSMGVNRFWGIWDVFYTYNKE
ncbi:MAG: hypothetical protein H7A23_23320 [Leptospiraceae bacterium]|nr:hypothetical protein [Leptospiraceae bacterium]MCP5497498.1 hypothetical protein [Leptospiraceae bacterium]